MSKKISSKSLLKSHPFKTLFLSFFLLFVFVEIVSRIVFAAKDYRVGSLIPSWWNFEKVDTLITERVYFTDEKGIFKTRHSNWEKGRYIINNDGFRGREFVRTPADSFKSSILFIGDSFTWGLNASPIQNCFVDLIDRESYYLCFNGGIPGADPAQYELIASQYVPKLKPDFVIVIIYIANDLMDEPRRIIPGRDLYFQTNAGWLPSFYMGQYFASAQESYDYACKTFLTVNPLKELLMKTAIGTAIFSASLRIKEHRNWRNKIQSPVTNEYLKGIKAICEENESRLLVFVIPPVQTDVNSSFSSDPDTYIKKKYTALVQGLESEIYVLPMSKEHYQSIADGHFNNEGHRIAAGFIRLKLLGD